VHLKTQILRNPEQDAEFCAAFTQRNLSAGRVSRPARVLLRQFLLSAPAFW